MQTSEANRQQVPSPTETLGPDQSAAHSAPSAEAIEAWMVDQLAGALGRKPEEIDVTRPLTMLGLSSIDAFSLTGELSEWLGQELPSTLLWEYPTVKDLARHLGPSTRHVAASFQEQMWFLQQLAPESRAYHIPFHVRLRGPLNVAALEQSLNEIRRRHDVLRTAFEAADGLPVQVVAAPKSEPLLIEDLQHLDPQERELTARRLSLEETCRPFDLAVGPLLRCRLLRLAAEDYVLLRTIHHAIADGWSLGVFRYELAALYEAFSTGKASSLSELPVQYAEFVQRQRKHLTEQTLESQLSYWKLQLADPLPHLSLPQRQVHPNRRTWQGAQHGLAIPAPLVDSLRELGGADRARRCS